MGQQIASNTEAALSRIEQTILPGLAMTLEVLLETAQNGPSYTRAAELRAIAEQLEALTEQVQVIAPVAQPALEWPLRIFA